MATKTANQNDRVAKFYNDNSLREVTRLSSDAYHRLEFEVTLAFLRKYLAPQQRIIEIGCGPAPYTPELVGEGRKVLLSDISQGMVDEAKKKLGARDPNPAGKPLYVNNINRCGFFANCELCP